MVILPAQVLLSETSQISQLTNYVIMPQKSIHHSTHRGGSAEHMDYFALFSELWLNVKKLICSILWQSASTPCIIASHRINHFIFLSDDLGSCHVTRGCNKVVISTK